MNEFETHLIVYPIDGEQYVLEVQATSADDAMRRLRRAAAFGKYDGVLQATVPAFPGIGYLLRAVTWLANHLPWPR